MSTYLLVYASGPFGYIETSYVSPLSGKTRPLRFYCEFTLLFRPSSWLDTATPDVVKKGQYCLDISARALGVYEKFFDIEFPLPKLDTLAIPEGGSGAMENWASN
jgi:aminopeptidase 2